MELVIRSLECAVELMKIREVYCYSNKIVHNSYFTIRYTQIYGFCVFGVCAIAK
jgi:hypothetical protein